MSSVYEDRLELLLAGYTRNVHIDSIPSDIIHHCQIWLKEKTVLSITRWIYMYTQLPLELQLTGFINKIINYQHIDRYEVKCVMNPSSTLNKSQNLTKQDRARMFIRNVHKIYDSNCLAFVGKGEITQGQTRAPGVRQVSEWGIKVSVYDKRSRIICESCWRSFDRLMPTFFSHKQYDHYKIEEYFNENIDIDNKGFVNVEKWIIAMKQTEIITEDEMAKKVFYLICSVTESKRNEVDADMFMVFLCDDGYQKYNKEYISFMQCCRRKIGFIKSRW